MPKPALSRRPALSALAALTILAAAIRLYRIGHQGLWFDEAYTVMLVKLPLAKLISTVPRTESTPYLYYVLAWIWTRVFGRGAADLRSLSALFGTLVIPVAYLTVSKLLASRRAALIVAVLATLNPLLIWYSQEARAYELLVLTSALTLLAFVYARERSTPPRLAAWGLASAAALVTHYDSALVVVPEAVWLLAQHRRELRTWIAVAVVAACGGALIPLLAAQTARHNAAWIVKAPLNDRLGQILPQFFLGTGSHAYRPLMYVAFALGLVGLVLLARLASSTERAAALGIGAIAVGGFALVMIVKAAGSDTVLTRNLLALWLPAAIVLAAGLGADRAGRLGLAVTAAICALGVTATVSVLTDGALQRPDWPAVARALGPWPAAHEPARATRLLLFQRNPWLESLTQVYMTDTHKFPHERAPRVGEIDIVVNTAPPSARLHWLCWWGAGCNLYATRLQSAYRIPGFHPVSYTHVKQFTILKLVADRPRSVTRAQLSRALTFTHLRQDGLLIQR